MKKYLFIIVGLFILAGCQNERPTIDVNTNQTESNISDVSNESNESSSSVSSSSEEKDKMVQAIEEVFQDELENDLIEIKMVTDETTEAIPEPHKEYKIIPIDEDYQQTLLDSVYRIHNGTASDEERNIIRTIFDKVKELASNFDNDIDAIAFEFKNSEDQPILIAKSSRVEDFIQYDFEYHVESEFIDEPESSVDDYEENVDTNSNTYIPQPIVPDDWQSSNEDNSTSPSNDEESAQSEPSTNDDTNE